MTNQLHYGLLQNPTCTVYCTDRWHDVYQDKVDTGTLDTPYAETGSHCPTCDCEMMPGGCVSRTFATEYKRRVGARVCVASRGGKFLCLDNKAGRASKDTDCCLCKRHGG
jgi:hypothetical protein